MSAPSITVTRGSVSYTVAPTTDPARPGWRITGNFTQAGVGAPFSFNVSLAKEADTTGIDADDLSATFTANQAVPVNELRRKYPAAASDEDAAIAEMQAMVDLVYDHKMPFPA